MPSIADDKKKQAEVLKILEDLDFLFYTPPSLNLEEKLADYPGTLDIKQIGKAKCFRIPKNAKGQAKKILILTDWTVKQEGSGTMDRYSQTGRYICTAIELLQVLRDVGFDIRVWDGKGVVPIVNFSDVKPQPASRKKIVNALIKNNIAADAVGNLDFFRLREIINKKIYFIDNAIGGDFPSTQVDEAFDHEHLNELIKFDRLAVGEWLLEGRVHLRLRRNDAYWQSTIDFIKSYHDRIEEIELDKCQLDAFTLMLSLSNLKTLHIDERDKTQVENWDEVSISGNGFPQLEKITFSNSNITPNKLMEIMVKSKNINHLRLEDCHLGKPIDLLSNDNLWQGLQKLELEDTIISESLLRALLYNKLVKLNLNNIEIVSEPNLAKLPTIDFSELNTLTLDDIEQDDWIELIMGHLHQTGSALEILTIKSDNEFLPTDPGEKSKVINLKQLILAFKNNYDPMFIINLLHMNAHLELLNIMGVAENVHLDYRLLKPGLRFAHLKDLFMRLSNNVPLMFYLKVASAAPLVSEINLSYQNLTSRKHDFEDADFDLEHVKNIDLSSATIPNATLFFMLSKCVGVQNLNLMKVNLTDLKASDIPDDLSLPHLRTLNLEETGIHGEVLSKFIEKCPNLDNLSIKMCNLDGFEMSKPRRKIAEISLSEPAHLKVKTFVSLVKYSQLSKIEGLDDLIADDNINDLELLNDVEFDDVKSLQIHSKDTRLPILQKIFSKLSHLETLCILTVSRDEFIEASAIPDNIHFPEIKFIEISACITGAALCKLLKSCPNVQKILISGIIKDISVEQVSEVNFTSAPQIEFSNYEGPFIPLLYMLLKKSAPTGFQITPTEIVLNDVFPTKEIPFNEKIPDTIIFERVKKLHINLQYTDYNAINSLINALPNLETLFLNIGYFGELEKKEHEEPKKLRELTITSDYFSRTYLYRLLTANPLLETLELEIMQLSGDSDFSTCAFNNLKKLRLSETILPKDVYKQIFLTAINLETIDIYYRTKIKIPNDTKCTSVRKIRFEDVDCEGNLPAIVSDKLEELELHACTLLNIYPKYKVPANINLTALKKIDICDTRMDKDFLFDIITSAKNLNSLRYKAKESDNIIFRLFNNYTIYTQLEELDLSNLTLPSEFFNMLPVCFPNLKILKLNQCDILPSVLNFNYKTDSKLLHVEITESRLSEKSVLQLLLQSRQLTDIKLSDNELKPTDAPRQNFKLPHLKNITLDKSTISRQTFYDMIQSTNILDTLNIESVQFNPEHATKDTLNLPPGWRVNKLSNNSSDVYIDLIFALAMRKTGVKLNELKDDSIKLILLHEQFNGNPYFLTQLERLDITDLESSVDTLILFIKKMNLSVLRITEANISGELSGNRVDEIVAQPAFQHLLELSFFGSYNKDTTIPGSLFLALLQASSGSLQQIRLNNIKISDLSIDDIPPLLYLPNVLQFDFDVNTLSQDVIEALKERMPKLPLYLRESKTNDKLDTILQDLNNDDLDDLSLESISNMLSQLSDGGSQTEQSLFNHLSHTRNQRLLGEHKGKGIGKRGKQVASKPKTKENKQYYSDTSYEPGKGERNITARQYFRPKEHPSNFRLQAVTQFKHVGKHIKLESDISDLEHIDINFVKNPKIIEEALAKKILDDDERYRICDKRLTLTHKWCALPSLTPYEEIQLFHINNQHNIEIKYSKKNNFYFIRLKDSVKAKSQKVTMKYFIDKYKNKPVNHQHSLPQSVKDLVAYCESFHEGEFTVPDDWDSQQILVKRYETKIGACGIRSMVFKEQFDLLKRENPILFDNLECRYIHNKPHAFVEIIQGGVPMTYDLRGYEAQLSIKEQQQVENPLWRQLEQMIEQRTVAEGGQGVISQIQAAFTSTLPPQPRIIEESELNPKLAIWLKAKKVINNTEILKKLPRPKYNTLIKCNQPDDCLSVIAAFNQAYPDTPYFLVDSPDDLQIKSKGLRNDGQNQLSILPKSTQLSEFIKNNPHGVIFVNWSRFDKTELTALHCILDKKRTLEGLPFASENPIVSFYSDNIVNPYKGLDFYSRQQKIADWQNDKTTIDLYAHRNELLTAPPTDATIINLYNSNDWESLLYGIIKIEDKQFKLAPSEFFKQDPIQAIHLVNPPWHIREFDLFWQSALQQRQFTLYGKTYQLAKDFKLTSSISKELATEVVIEKNALATIPLTLNNQTISRLFTHYLYHDNSFIDQDSVFHTHPERAGNNEFLLTVTESLSFYQWMRLLNEAKNHGVKLVLQLSEGVTLPEEMQGLPHRRLSVKPRALTHARDLQQPGMTLLYCEKPAGVLAKELARAIPDAEYVSFSSAHNLGDLFYRITSNIPTPNEVEAILHESAIWKMLKANKTVIIEGDLPEALVQALAPYFLNNENKLVIEGVEYPYSGKLIFVTNTKVPFAAQQITCQDKETIQTIYDLSQISEKEQIPPYVPKLMPATNDLSQGACDLYTDDRFNSIMHGFHASPIIFYSGATGIGKTTYLLNHFVQEYALKNPEQRSAALYIGEAALKDFARHSDSQTDPILFIDEANLSQLNLSILKGIRSPKPHLLIEGEYYPLPKNAKVILAGNKKDYGGVRDQQEFIDQYCADVECDKPNHAYNYRTILQPILNKVFEDSQTSGSSQESTSLEENIAVILLDLFDKVNEWCGKPNPHFSPRHLHMMAMVFSHYFQKYGKLVDKRELAVTSVLTILGDALPDIKPQLKEYIKNTYRINPDNFYHLLLQETREHVSSLPKHINIEDTFTYVESRIPAILQIETFIAMRHMPGFHFGLALEGSTSTGKSDLLYNYLKVRYPNEVVQMSLGSNYESDREEILAAFNEGKFLIIDEINAGGPRYEKLINTLVMGKDESGQNPKKPGFLVFTTRNSLKMEGRQALPLSVEARFSLIDIPKYTNQDLEMILVNKGVNKARASQLVHDYDLCLQYAKQHRIKLRPKLRNLLEAAGIGSTNKKETDDTANQEFSKVKTVTFFNDAILNQDLSKTQLTPASSHKSNKFS